jgi:hypothetical protein
MQADNSANAWSEAEMTLPVSPNWYHRHSFFKPWKKRHWIIAATAHVK